MPEPLPPWPGTDSGAVEKLREEIAKVVQELGSGRTDEVPSVAAVEEGIAAAPSPVAHPRLLMPDIHGRDFAIANVVAPAANRLMLFRASQLTAGTLRGLKIFLGAKGPEVIGAVYDTGEAEPGHYSRLAEHKSTPAEEFEWNEVVDPNLEGDLREQRMIGFICSAATGTIGRGSEGALSNHSSELPPGYLDLGGGNLGKAAGFVEVGAFEAPATIAEAALSTNGPIPFMMIGRIE